MSDSSTIFENVSWLRTMLPSKKSDLQILCNEVNGEVLKSNGRHEYLMNLEIYQAIVLALAGLYQRARERFGKVCPDENRRAVVSFGDTGVFLKMVTDGRFNFLENLGAYVPEAVAAHLLQIQFIPPLADRETMLLWAMETARVILNHLPKAEPPPSDDADGLARWGDDGGR